MKKRTLSILLLAAMLLSSVACGEEGGTSQNDTTAPSDTTAPVEDDSPKLEVPKSNYGNRTFTILSTEHASYEYDAEEQTGDVVNDAVYNRNRDVEDLLGIKFNIITEPGQWNDRDTFKGLITNSIMAQDNAYDLVSGVTVIVLPLAAEGYFVDANELKYVNFDNPWWVQGMNDTLAINNKLYGFIGDASLSLYKDLSVTYFNKQILENYQLDDPYQLVRDNKWTIDTMLTMITQVSDDINGDGKITPENDLLGLISCTVPSRAIQTACEVKIVETGDDGVLKIAQLAERDYDLSAKIYEVFKNEDYVYNVDGTNIAAVNAQLFADGHSLFMNNFLYATETLRDMDDDFGMVPYAKRDEDQENFHTQIGTSTSMFFVPKTSADLELTSMVCESLCYYGYKGVTPAYYEVALKDKYARDTEVKEMLNIIRDSAQMDFTFAYSTAFSPFINCLFEFGKGNTMNENLASHYATNITKWEATMEEILEAYADIE